MRKIYIGLALLTVSVFADQKQPDSEASNTLYEDQHGPFWP